MQLDTVTNITVYSDVELFYKVTSDIVTNNILPDYCLIKTDYISIR